MMWELWDRVIKNWHTSSVAIIAGVVIVMQWSGITVVANDVIIVMAAVEAFILLFARD